jgi:hypothetical protein
MVLTFRLEKVGRKVQEGVKSNTYLLVIVVEEGE